MPFTVAVINSNGTMIEDHTGDVNNIRNEITNQINKLVANIDDYVTFIDVDNPQEMIELAINKCKMIPDVTMGYTTTCYEDNNLIYQLIHVHYGNDIVESENNKINAIATTLAENKTPIFNCTILTCSMMDENGINFVPTNVTKQHLIDLIKLRSYHKGMLIDENSCATETTFVFDPYECFDLIIKSNKENGNGEEHLEPNMSMINIVLGGFDIVCVCDKNANAKLNHFASFMFKLEIKGACLMYIRHKGSDFINFDQVFFDKIKLLLSNDKREELINAKQQDYLIKQYRLIDALMMSQVK
jgi:hypothetical protein